MGGQGTTYMEEGPGDSTLYWGGLRQVFAACASSTLYWGGLLPLPCIPLVEVSGFGGFRVKVSCIRVYGLGSCSLYLGSLWFRVQVLGCLGFRFRVFRVQVSGCLGFRFQGV